MIINTYIYKGQNSLFAPCVVGVIQVPDDNINYEAEIPTISYIYNKRQDISCFSTMMNKINYSVGIINADDINDKGDYAIRDKLKRMTLNYRIKALYDNNICHIKRLHKPKLWYERLLVIATVFYRHKLLYELSRDLNFIELDSDYNKHLDIIKDFRLLPRVYNWEKTMLAFRNVFPRPLWYDKEIEKLKIMKGEL